MYSHSQHRTILSIHPVIRDLLEFNISILHVILSVILRLSLESIQSTSPFQSRINNNFSCKYPRKCRFKVRTVNAYNSSHCKIELLWWNCWRFIGVRRLKLDIPDKECLLAALWVQMGACLLLRFVKTQSYPRMQLIETCHVGQCLCIYFR